MKKDALKQKSACAMTIRLRKQLESLAESSYKKFQEALVPGCTNMLGVRIPLIRKIAKETIKASFLAAEKSLVSINDLCKNDGTKEVVSYLHESDELYYEEYILKALLIGELGNFRAGFLAKVIAPKNNSDSTASYQPQNGTKTRKVQSCPCQQTDTWTEFVLNEIRLFIPKITNWGICDTFCAALKITKKEPERMWSFLETYIRSEQTYEIRFAVVMYLDYYIDTVHLPLLFERFERISSTDYYVKMAVAWALSQCFVKFPSKTKVFLNRHTIDDDTYKKTLRKISESRQVPEEIKIKRH